MTRVLHRSGAIPPVAVRGEGIYLYTEDGSRIIDASGGAAVACLGHGDRRVAEAIGRQAAAMAYAHIGTFSNQPAEDLADILLHDEPGGLSRTWFCSSGSEGNEAAIKLARQYFLEIGQPQRTKTIARRQSYHGTTLGALAAGGNMMRRAHYEPILSQAHTLVSPCFAYRFKAPRETDAQYLDRLIEELDAEFRRVGADTVMAFLAEPVVGATTGCVAALPGYFQRVRAICDRYGALMILDEVMCGMGRTGTLHAWEQEDVTPDIQVIGKGLGGGYQPIGGILIADRIVRALAEGSGGFLHGQTYQAHPAACAAALEVQRIIKEDDLLANVQAMGRRLEAALHQRFGNHRHVGDVRGRGLFWALELVSDRATRAPFDPLLKLHERVKAEGIARGLATYPMGGTIDGKHGDHVIVAPPYIATAADMDAIVQRLGDAVDAVTGSL
ncbi:MAG: aspartate aminotransferase family protein [Rhodopila sp.]